MDTNRRDFMAAGGLGLAALAFAGATGASAEDSALTAREQANLKVVNDFCAAWDTRDAEKLGAFWDDKITFRIIEGQPRVEGKAALIEGTKQFLASRKEAHFEVLRSAAMGNLVINERIDHFTRADGKDAFHVTGMFYVRDGKIVEWQDYSMPKL
jgi:limonene-1,2-epoxide hydrolase